MSGTLASERRLLCEGWLEEWAEGEDDLVMYPQAAYVVNDGKVWFARGGGRFELAALEESVGTSLHLVESVDEMELEEQSLPDGKAVKLPKGDWFVEGVFQRSDTPNANKRVYPRKIWDRLIADEASYVQRNIAEGGMLGHLEHPKDGRTDGKEGAIVTTAASLQKDGTVWGRAKVLGTPNGLILREYTRSGVRWGVSSRGNGSVGDDGVVDSDNYLLESWDAVMKPSVPGAFPTAQVKEEDDVEEAKNIPYDPKNFVKAGLPRLSSSDYKKVMAAHAKLQQLFGKRLRMAHRRKLEDGTNIADEAFSALKKAGVAQSDLKRLSDHLINLLHGAKLESTDEPCSSDTVNEADEYVAEVTQLVETPFDSLDPVTRSQLCAKIAQAAERGSALHGEGKLEAGQVLSLVQKLTRYSARLVESENGDLDAVIDDALRQADEVGGEDRTDGFTRVTDSLKERLTDALAEAEHLRERLGVAESTSTVAQGQLEDVIEQLAEVEGKLGTTESKLKLAEELLATRPESQRSGAVTATVDRVIGEVSALERFRDVLLLARDASHVEEIAERLLPAAVRPIEESMSQPDVAEGGSPAPRRTLPSLVVVESDNVELPPTTEDVSKPVPRQVAVAGAVLEAMEGRTAGAGG